MHENQKAKNNTRKYKWWLIFCDFGNGIFKHKTKESQKKILIDLSDATKSSLKEFYKNCIFICNSYKILDV